MKRNIFFIANIFIIISNPIYPAQIEKKIAKDLELEKLNKQLYDNSAAGNLEEVEKLLQQGAQPDGFTDYIGQVALYVSIGRYITSSEESYLKIADLLIKNGTNINYENYNGYTALDNSFYNLNKKCLLYLVEMGAQINHQNKYGMTSLMRIMDLCKRDNKNQVDLFLSCTNFEYNLDILDNEKHSIEYYIDQISNLEVKNLIKSSLEQYRILQKQKIEHIQKCLTKEILPDLTNIVAEYLGITNIQIKSKKRKIA